MALYSIEWKKSARKELRKLEKSAIPRVLEVVKSLIYDPYPAGSRKLQCSEHLYRVRIGDYRVVYSVKNEVLLIEVIRVGHRKDIYRNLI
ncbi:MAG: type II toxin-antitoxin system RelE/ParE family toxin [Candidatus Hydrogenedentes bacterium]|nr:type II toxin-antitoxin system RelE/ParE family toxin [Candidatus Hydrogenedentota bacterium]